MKAVIVINYASEEDIGKKASIHLLNEENEWVEDVMIKPMPQEREFSKRNILPINVDGNSFVLGWNSCLKEITK